MARCASTGLDTYYGDEPWSAWDINQRDWYVPELQRAYRQRSNYWQMVPVKVDFTAQRTGTIIWTGIYDLEPAIDSIDAFESSLPKRRAAQLDATELSKMMGLLTLLSDPSYLSSLRTAKLEIEEEEDPTDAPGSVTTSQDNFLTGMLAAISTTSNTPPTQVAGFY